jgi:hypothetical protein
LAVYFNYGRYDVVRDTAEGLGQNQYAKLEEFVRNARSVRASQIEVSGYASPEQNLPSSGGTQLPIHRAEAAKSRLDFLFAGPDAPTGPSIRPNITVRTTQVLGGDPAAWPSLRRADVYIVLRAI